MTNNSFKQSDVGGFWCIQGATNYRVIMVVCLLSYDSFIDHDIICFWLVFMRVARTTRPL